MKTCISGHDSNNRSGSAPRKWARCSLVMGAIATYFLLSEHRAHFLGALPLLLLLSCPLMHVFMHHGHGEHGGHAHQQTDEVSANLSATAPPPSGDRP